MELLALGKPIKKPPRSDERDGELFCGTIDPVVLSPVATNVGFSAETGRYYAIEVYVTNSGATSFTFNGATILAQQALYHPAGSTVQLFIVQATMSIISCYISGTATIGTMYPIKIS